jgi:hypothetical protein
MAMKRARLTTAVLATIVCLLAGAAVTTAQAAPIAIKTANAPVVKKVVGTGTAASCTDAKLRAAVRTGGNITFNCGPKAVTIKLKSTLTTCNTSNCKHKWQGGRPLTAMTLDGGGKVTLDGGGKFGIFYANSCEESFGWLSGACQNDKTLLVTFKNITFKNGNATKGVPGKASVGGGGGGGAIAMRGNRLKVSKVTFSNNICMKAASDAGGGAIRVVGMATAVSIYKGTFTSNRCANGGAVSSLSAPVNISSSTFTSNKATGTSGKGGNGGAVYFDGAGAKSVAISSSKFTSNTAPAGGPMVFYVSNDRKGSLAIRGTTATKNTGQSFYTKPYKPIFFKGKKLTVTSSSIH